MSLGFWRQALAQRWDNLAAVVGTIPLIQIAATFLVKCELLFHDVVHMESMQWSTIYGRDLKHMNLMIGGAFACTLLLRFVREFNSHR